MTAAHDQRAMRSASRRLPQTSLQYLDGLLRHAGGVMYVRDAVDSRFLMVNPAFEELLGQPADRIVGRTGHDIFPFEVAEAHRANDLLVLSDGLARTSHELAPGPDGSMREFVSHKFALLDPLGKPYAIGGISTDITEIQDDLRAAATARQESEARFRAVFQHAPIGQIFSEIGGAVSATNEALAAMLGYRVEEMLGHRIAEFAEPEEFARITEDAGVLLAGRDTVTAIRRFLHKDGHRVPVRVTSALLRDENGDPRWWVSMVMNLTSEERARAELERAHAETVMAARRLGLLNQVAGAANDSVDLDGAAAQILPAIGRHFGWPRGALLRCDADPEGAISWTSVAEWASPAEPEPPAALRPAEQLLATLTGSAPADVRQFGAAETGGTPVIMLPLSVDSRLRYVWYFSCEQPIDADDLSLLQLIGLETTRLVERQIAQEQLAESERRFRSIFVGSPLPMALTLGTSGKFSAVNQALCQLVGRPASDLIGRPATDLCHPDDAALADPAGAAALAAPDGRHVFQMRLVHAAGSVIDCVITLTWMEGTNGTRNLLAQMEDVTARRLAEESLRKQADEDPLTGLANRAYFNRLLARHAATAESSAVLFIDLDGFKLINDSCGHEVGDEVLIEVSRRLLATVRPSDTVARLGGDEFVVLCPGSRGTSDADLIADRISQSLRASIQTAAGPVRITASVGIADGEIPLGDPTELVHRADTAMYRAKHLGKDRREVYDAALHQQALNRSSTEAALRTALEDDRFILHYQPIVDLGTGDVLGFEALVRLLDDAGQLVAPERFIAVAEQSGLIIPMGSWVLRPAARTLAELRSLSGRDLFMAVNVAPSQVSRDDLIHTVDSALAEAGLPPRSLALELTESALLEADSNTLKQLNTLRSSGIQIALDDFGTGYSSLAYLRTFPVGHLKIDRSFISGISELSGDLAIVRAIAGMAADLGLGCVAEGVETVLQRDLLVELGVPAAQGYLFARPLEHDRLADLLATGLPVPPPRG
jgi:diguanylate cyclase (GGDEF)-like protein/PAS domain S-box-containing protein